MEEIFNRLHASRRANQLAMNLEGRSPFATKAVVTNNSDPEDLRRIKVTVASKGGQTEVAGWLWRLTPDPYSDPPVPRVGQTVAVMFFDGDPHDGCYLGVLTNRPNPQRDTYAPVLDDARSIEGDQVEDIQGDRLTDIKGSDSLTVEQTVTIQNAAGASIVLNTDGTIAIVAPAGIRITCNQESTINGKAIAVVGAGDNDSEGNGSDTITRSGQL